MVSLGRADSMCYQARLPAVEPRSVAAPLKKFRFASKGEAKATKRTEKQNEFEYKAQENRMVAVAQW